MKQCMFCKYYRYDSELSKAFWKLTQEEHTEIPQIGRCVFEGKKYGNAVLSSTGRSDACGAFRNGRARGERRDDECPNYEERENSKFRPGDIFDDKGCNTAIFISEIQPQFYPRDHRIKTVTGGGWSLSEEELSNEQRYTPLYREKG